MLVLDDFLGTVEAAAAQGLAVQRRKGLDWAFCAFAGGGTQFIFANRIADTDDHADCLTDNANHSQEKIDQASFTSLPREIRSTISAIGIPTKRMCANI